MTSTTKLAAAVLLSAMTLTPVFAQAAIQEPGASVSFDSFCAISLATERPRVAVRS